MYTPVALMWPEDIPADARDAMDEYATYGEPLEIGGQLAKQSTAQTCGAMVLLVSQSLSDPAVAERVASEGIDVVEKDLYAELRRGALNHCSGGCVVGWDGQEVRVRGLGWRRRSARAASPGLVRAGDVEG